MRSRSNTGLPLMRRRSNYFSYEITHVPTCVSIECNCELTEIKSSILSIIRETSHFKVYESVFSGRNKCGVQE
jgi:hypothetical protein